MFVWFHLNKRSTLQYAGSYNLHCPNQKSRGRAAHPELPHRSNLGTRDMQGARVLRIIFKVKAVKRILQWMRLWPQRVRLQWSPGVGCPCASPMATQSSLSFSVSSWLPREGAGVPTSRELIHVQALSRPEHEEHLSHFLFRKKKNFIWIFCSIV